MYEKALVLGLGDSGDAAARLLLSEGSSVTVVDASDNESLQARRESLQQKGSEVSLGLRDLPSGHFDICVVSPGISSDSDWVREIEGRGIDVISELELAASRCGAPILAITGSNGKSTMTKLCCDAINNSGQSARIAGNYGFPLSGVVMEENQPDWMVVEVSSFQLEKVRTFKPSVGVLMNIQPDHLDRHGDMESYRAVKSRLFDRMDEDDLGVVLDQEMERVSSLTAGNSRWVTFGPEGQYQYADGAIVNSVDNSSGRVLLKGTIFDNEIMGLTAAAAVAALGECGVDTQAMEKSFSGFEPLPHRMERVIAASGVTFIDDSKATNMAALEAGVIMAGDSVRLIAGGLLKEKNLETVKDVLAKRVKSVYLIGKSAKMLEDAWGDVVPCIHCGELSEAVKAALSDASHGDVVLLSPGCASFDQFNSYKDRGQSFKRIINEEVR